MKTKVNVGDLVVVKHMLSDVQDFSDDLLPRVGIVIGIERDEYMDLSNDRFVMLVSERGTPQGFYEWQLEVVSHADQKVSLDDGTTKPISA